MNAKAKFLAAAALLAAAIWTIAPLTTSAQSATRYRILVTNDDGVRAPGLIALADALDKVGDVTVIAPAQNQSAVAHALTMADPIYEDTVTIGNGRSATALSAT